MHLYISRLVTLFSFTSGTFAELSSGKLHQSGLESVSDPSSRRNRMVIHPLPRPVTLLLGVLGYRQPRRIELLSSNPTAARGRRARGTRRRRSANQNRTPRFCVQIRTVSIVYTTVACQMSWCASQGGGDPGSSRNMIDCVDWPEPDADCTHEAAQDAQNDDGSAVSKIARLWNTVAR